MSCFFLFSEYQDSIRPHAYFLLLITALAETHIKTNEMKE